MKAKTFVLGLLAFGLWACGESGPSEADLQAEAEANRLDSLSQVIETSVDEVEDDAAALEESLKALDELLPEEAQ